MAVVKAINTVQRNDELNAFVMSELRDHVERLRDCAYEQADEVTIDYHHEKAIQMIEVLEGDALSKR